MVFFFLLLVVPLLFMFLKTFNTDGNLLAFYQESFADRDMLQSVLNSIKISALAGLIATSLGFLLAYGINRTTINRKVKYCLELAITLPMLLPTITYGFAIIYSFGKKGLITSFFSKQLFEIYGFNGLLLAYVIYTLPIAFWIINDGFKYIENKYVIVAKLMKDPWYRSLYHTTIRPLLAVLVSTFLLTFVLSFTDFGIPASVGGTYNVIATNLYQTMLGSVPDFGKGSVIALIMLFPSAVGVFVLNKLDKLKVNYNQNSLTSIEVNRKVDAVFLLFMCAVTSVIVSIFLVMFVTPFMKNYPYDLTFTLDHMQAALSSNGIWMIFKNTLFIAFTTGLLGTVLAYFAAILNTRSRLSDRQKLGVDFIAMLTNGVPGMVLGLSYLFLFKGSMFKETYLIIILCNVVHFFTTPYIMAKNALSKLNSNYEIIGSLLGDSWLLTIFRVIIPNSAHTLIQMFSYYMIHSMITVSAIIFLVTAKTAVLTSKIKALQHYANFSEIFILSIMIFMTNLVIRFVAKYIESKLATNE